MFLIGLFFVCCAGINAQLKVDSLGQVGVGTANPQYKLNVVGNTCVDGNIYLGSAFNYIGTTAQNTPITFKLGNSNAGNTGHSGNTNVSFGYESLSNSTGNNNSSIG
jgi:hypothetical protein